MELINTLKIEKENCLSSGKVYGNTKVTRKNIKNSSFFFIHHMVLTVDPSLNTARRIDNSGIVNVQYSIKTYRIKIK